MVNQIFWLKRLFPKSKFVCIEEDVTFLKKKRIYDNACAILKFFKYPFFELFKKIEIFSLNLCDLVVLNNEKDEKLVAMENVNVDKMFICHPFFQNMSHLQCKCSSKDILFYGAMDRAENYRSAIWFIETVFPKLEEFGFRFIVVGNKPHESLKKYDNGRNICVTGFVEDISPFFQNSLCLVAPLLLGAGIKIKIIEAMSCGLPVLTNEIGIEGIPAENGKEYFFCSKADEYKDAIFKLSSNAELGMEMGMNAKSFIQKNFNYQQDAEILYKKICAFVS